MDKINRGVGGSWQQAQRLGLAHRLAAQGMWKSAATITEPTVEEPAAFDRYNADLLIKELA